MGVLLWGLVCVRALTWEGFCRGGGGYLVIFLLGLLCEQALTREGLHFCCLASHPLALRFVCLSGVQALWASALPMPLNRWLN